MPAQSRPIPNRAIPFAIAAFVCIVYALALAWGLSVAHSNGMSTSELLTASGDAQDYVSLAHTILDAQRYALLPGSPPEFFRAPGYPIFIAGVLAVFNSVFAVIVIQILLIAGSCVILYKLGEQFFSRGVGIAAALVFALDPTVIFNSLITLSESLFVFLLLLAVYMIANRKGGAWRMFLIGLVVGALALTRPVGPFVVPLFLLYFLWTHRSDSKRSLFAGSLALILGMALLILPWLVRNERLSGHFAISSIPTYNMLFYNVVEYETEIMHVPKEEFIQQLFSELGTSDVGRLRTFEYQEEESALVRQYIGPHILSYAFFHVAKTAPFFIGSSLNDTERTLINLQLIDRAQKPAVSISGLVLNGDWRGVFRILRESPYETGERILWMLAFVFAAGYVLFAIMGRHPRVPEVLLFAALVCLLAILVGPIAQTRYRIPAEPFLLLLAFEGVRLFMHKARELITRFRARQKLAESAGAVSIGKERN